LKWQCDANVPPVIDYANIEDGSLLRVSMPLKFSGQVGFVERRSTALSGSWA
jgi:hypothetical protein